MKKELLKTPSGTNQMYMLDIFDTYDDNRSSIKEIFFADDDESAIEQAADYVAQTYKHHAIFEYASVLSMTNGGYSWDIIAKIKIAYKAEIEKCQIPSAS
jgi:hypothetical protein